MYEANRRFSHGAWEFYAVRHIIPGGLMVIFWLKNGLTMVNNGMIWDLASGKLTVCY
jgi:hypothetical protein